MNSFVGTYRYPEEENSDYSLYYNNDTMRQIASLISGSDIDPDVWDSQMEKVEDFQQHLLSIVSPIEWDIDSYINETMTVKDLDQFKALDLGHILKQIFSEGNVTITDNDIVVVRDKNYIEKLEFIKNQENE